MSLRKRVAHAKDRSTTHRLGSNMKTALGLRQFDDLERNAVFSGGGRWLLPGVALIDECDLHALSGLRLNGLGDTADFGPIIRVGGRDMQSQKMAKRVDGQVELRSLLAFGAVISGASAALRGRAQGPAVGDDGGWLLAPARCKTQDDAQVLSQSLEASRLQPSLRLLVDDLPWRQVVRHPAPWGARLHDIAHAIEHLAQRMRALRTLLRQKRQIRRDKRPFAIGNVRRISFAGHRHPAILRIYS